MTAKPAKSYGYVKWIFGILFLISIGFTLLFSSLALVTSKERAIKTVATAVAEAFSKKGIDDPLEVTLLKRQVETTASHEIYPIAGLNISLTPKDFEVKLPRDVRINFFSKLVAPIYEDGEKGLETLANDPDMRAKLKDALGLPLMLSKKNHVMFLIVSVTLGVLSLVLLTLLIVFSEKNDKT